MLDIVRKMLNPPKLFSSMESSTFSDVTINTKTKKLSGVYNIDLVGPFIVFYKNQPRNCTFLLHGMLYQIIDYNTEKSTLTMASIDKLNQYIFSFEFKLSTDFERFKEKFLDIFNSYLRIVSTMKPGGITADGQFLALLPGEKEALKCFAVIQKLAKWEFQLHFFGAGHENEGIKTEITKNIVLSTELEVTKLGNQSIFSQSFIFRDANQPVSQSIHIKCGSIDEMMDFLSIFHAFITLAQMNKLYAVEKPSIKETPKIPNSEIKNEQETKENVSTKQVEELKQNNPEEIQKNESTSPEIKILYQKPQILKENEDKTKDEAPIEPIKTVEIKDTKEEISEIKILYEKPQKTIEEPTINQNNTEVNDKKEEKSEIKIDDQISEENQQEINQNNDAQQNEIEQIIIPDKIEMTKSELPPDYFYISPFEGKPFKFNPVQNELIHFDVFSHIYEDDVVPDATNVNFLDLNEKVTFYQKIPKKENYTENLSLFVKPTTVNFSESEIQSILSLSLSEFQDDKCQLPDNFTPPTFEGIGIINEQKFSKMTRKYDFDTSLLFEENSINFTPTKSEKPNCTFIEELTRTVQAMRISGLSVHREESDSLKLTSLLTSLFLNDRKSNMTLESIKSLLPSYEKEIDECCRKSDLTLQVFNFCINGLNYKFILPFLRIIRRNGTWIEENYNECSLMKSDNVLETVIELLEPLVIYHTFVLSASISINEEIIEKYSRKAFSYKSMIDLPKAKENHEIFVKTVSNCLFDGLKNDLIDFVLSIAKEYKDNELEITAKKAKKLPPKQHARTIVGDGLSTNNLVRWICMFISRADKELFETDANIFDPYRYNLILKSIVLSLK